MSAELVIGAVGSGAAVIALLWAFLGNPSIPNRLKAIRQSRSTQLASRGERRVLTVSWEDIEQAAAEFIRTTTDKYDLVIGIHPDGVNLATLVANSLGSRFVGMEKLYSNTRRAPFFVFDDTGHGRSERESLTLLSRPKGLGPRAKVLLVDGVTTFGNALLKGEEVIHKQLPESDVHFLVLAIDEPRLYASHPEVARRVHYSRKIDNHAVWLHFPWDGE